MRTNALTSSNDVAPAAEPFASLDPAALTAVHGGGLQQILDAGNREAIPSAKTGARIGSATGPAALGLVGATVMAPFPPLVPVGAATGAACGMPLGGLAGAHLGYTVGWLKGAGTEAYRQYRGD